MQTTRYTIGETGGCCSEPALVKVITETDGSGETTVNMGRFQNHTFELTFPGGTKISFPAAEGLDVDFRIGLPEHKRGWVIDASCYCGAYFHMKSIAMHSPDFPYEGIIGDRMPIMINIGGIVVDIPKGAKLSGYIQSVGAPATKQPDPNDTVDGFGPNTDGGSDDNCVCDSVDAGTRNNILDAGANDSFVPDRDGGSDAGHHCDECCVILTPPATPQCTCNDPNANNPCPVHTCSAGIGECHMGTQVCSMNPAGYQQPDINALDDDCDGTVDEGFTPGLVEANCPKCGHHVCTCKP